jgi:predicted RNase H-like HicB family nuclease
MKVRDIIKLLERGWLVSERDAWESSAIQALCQTGARYVTGASERRSSSGNSEQRPQTSGVEIMMNYVVIYEKSDTGWAAYVPDLPGVVTTGKTKAEVRSLIREAIGFHLDGLKEDRLPIPEPTAEAEVISI